MPAGASASRPSWRPGCKNCSTIPRDERMSDSKSRQRRQRALSATNGPPPAIDQERIQAAVTEILLAVGEDPDREGLRDTPARVARMYAELFAGVGQEPRELLKKT